MVDTNSLWQHYYSMYTTTRCKGQPRNNSVIKYFFKYYIINRFLPGNVSFKFHEVTGYLSGTKWFLVPSKNVSMMKLGKI